MSELCSADKVSYLANVFAICGADGRVTAPEVAVLKDVARRLNVTQAEVDVARNMIASGHYEMSIISDSRARRDNLEDMVMAALADGTIHEKESGPIEKLAKALRFVQADMDMLSRRAQHRLDGVLGAQAAADKKKAAAPQASPPPKPDPAPPPAEETPEAPAAEPEPEPEPETAPAAPVRPCDSRPSDVMACMRCRVASANSAGYCFGAGDALNVWGCRLLNQPWSAGSEWLTAGTFRPSGCFVFDRDAIRRLLDARTGSVACCPFFATAPVAQALAALPSQAWPGRRWKLRRSEGFETSTFLDVRRYAHGCMLHTKQSVAGVDPVGDALARRVIRDACRAAGRPVPGLD